MILDYKFLKFFILIKLLEISFGYTYDESLVMEGLHSKSLLLSRLVNNNYELFDFKEEPKYLEKDAYDKKFKIELILSLLKNTIYTNFSDNYFNELHANYMNEYFTDYKNQTGNFNDLFSFKNERFSKLLNQTWFIHCSIHKKLCLNECLKLSSKLNYKKHWCQLNRNNFKLRFKRQAVSIPSARSDFFSFFESNKQNISDELLIKEILDDLMRKNMNNNFAFINSLSGSIEKLKNTETNNNTFDSKSTKCENGFNYGLSNDECIDVNECDFSMNSNQTNTSNCDHNAVCINTLGSFKCKCKKGYVGDGTNGNCFSGKFCSGRFCRMNGECHYDNNLNGYKCRCMLNCMNGGKCVMTRYKYECRCPNNSTGVLCNETAQYRLFKVNYFNKINDLNSTENIKLSQLVSLVEPSLNGSDLGSFYNNTKFEMLNLFKNFISRPKKDNNGQENGEFYKTTIGLIKEEKQLDNLLTYLNHHDEHEHIYDEYSHSGDYYSHEYYY